jgi:hypothetical protein
MTENPPEMSKGKRVWRYVTEQDEAGAKRKTKRNEMQVALLNGKAAQQEARALKMSKKIGRGGRRSAKAVRNAESLRSGADRVRVEHTQPHQSAPTSPPPPQPLPGAAWYPDPKAEKRLRWWDGAIWTEHTAD